MSPKLSVANPLASMMTHFVCRHDKRSMMFWLTSALLSHASFSNPNCSISNSISESSSRFLTYGNYAEIPETCPVITTCPLICVQNGTECPTSCPYGMELCQDGSCADECDDELASPCECSSLSFACPKVVQYYESCFEDFQSFYDVQGPCDETEVPFLTFTEPAFLFCYFWISCVTGLVFSWCYFNQKLSPVEKSSQRLQPIKVENTERWIQTGYKPHLVGTIIYTIVILTLAGIHFLLFLLTILYYVQQETITQWPTVFYDESQVLLAFEIVWMIGLPWSFVFQFPPSIHSLFLRRCTLDQATFVAVEAPTTSISPVSSPRLTSKFSIGMLTFINHVMNTFFSYSYAVHGTSIQFCKVSDDGYYRSFYHRMRRYVFSVELGSFISGHVNVTGTINELLLHSRGLSTDVVATRGGYAGQNMLKLEKPTLVGCIMKEFNKSFYVYQAFMVWTWAPYWYYYMAIVNTSVRITSGTVSALYQYISDSTLYRLTIVEGNIVVYRDEEFFEISIQDVVPGDVVVVKPGTINCDIAILKGNRIKVDESALTGESAPITKEHLTYKVKSDIYCTVRHKANTIFAGTTVIEVDDREKVLGLVLSIGSFTTKGELLCEVLSYERHKMEADHEITTVIGILCIQAVVLLVLVFIFLNEQWIFAWFYGIFIVGTIFPPLLPSVFVVSIAISAKRLQDKMICCTNPDRILVAGKVDIAFFDKTGTLTQNGMEFLAIEPSTNGDEQLNFSRIQLGMAVCHTIHVTRTGEIIGNSIDLESLKSTTAKLNYMMGAIPEVIFEGQRYVILKRFEFDPVFATQSVIIRTMSGQKLAFVKGSPEAIKSISSPLSVPCSFKETVRYGEMAGIYQIAMGYKELDDECDVLRMERIHLEKEIVFCGFINFKNAIRPDAQYTLQQLKNGNIGVAMLTGDSIFTAISVARNCEMIDKKNDIIVAMKSWDNSLIWKYADSQKAVNQAEVKYICLENDNTVLAMTGDAWMLILRENPDYLASIANRIRIFARCKPADKVSVICTYIAYGRITLMCGDGQNDCGALKSAHIGVSMSSTEASIVSTFTSLEKKLSSVPEILMEGRCALASAFASYKYYIIYGQIESFLQVLNAYFAITFTEWCWVFLDGFWSISMAFSLPLSRAAKTLCHGSPTSSLLSSQTLFSTCGILTINFFFLTVALLALFSQDWFSCRKWNSNDVSNVLTIGDNYEASLLFIVGGYQYIASAIALNFGYTYRQSWWKNYVFVGFVVLWTLFVFVMTIHPSRFSCIWRVNCSNENVVRWVTQSEPVAINNYWNTTVMPVKFRWQLVSIIAANVICLVMWEKFIVNGYLSRRKMGRPE